MKIGGRTDFKERREITLIESSGSKPEIKVKIEALPLGFDALVESRVPSPRAPLKIITKQNGSPERYDTGPEKGKPIVAPDEQDPSYLAGLRKSQYRQGIAIFYEATRNDGTIEFDTEEPADGSSNGAWGEFYDNLFTEVRTSGIPAGCILNACIEVASLSGISQDKLKDAASDFS